MPQRDSAGAAAVGVECIIPILNVRNLSVSLDYYVKIFGFKIDWGGGKSSSMASVSRDGRAIMLCEGSQGHPGTWVWIGVDDIEPLFEQLKANGAVIRQNPTNYSWAYEMRVEDPDGHVLRIGSDSKADRPCHDRDA